MTQEMPFRSVLLVEDEQALAEALKIALARLKIESIRWATTIDEAKQMLSQASADLLILDRNLPDGDGLELCESLRAESYSGVILCLTAKGEPDDRVRGLDSGADDYLSKPFHWEELSARVRALARRFESREKNPTSVPTPSAKKSDAKKAPLWTIESERLRIMGRKGWVELTPLEFKLATHLIRAEGTIVTREELLKEVWGFRFLPKTRTTDYFLGRLRKVFEKDPDRPRHFITVRGAGYRFSAEPERDPQG